MFSSNVLKSWPFKKKSHLNMIFFVISEKVAFLFFPKISSFFFKRKMKDDLSQKIHGNMIFSVYMYKCYKYDITTLPKKAKIIFSRKNKVIGEISDITENMIFILFIYILGWYSRKSSNDFMYFYGDSYRRFYILLSSDKKKNRQLNI